MFWQRLSLSAKLFVAILATVLVVVVVITAAVATNMRSGFTNYLLNAEVGRLDGLRDALVAAPDAVQAWPSLRSPDRWTRFVEEQVRPQRAVLAPPPPDAPGFPPPRPIDPLQVSNRVVLMDVTGRVIAGPATIEGNAATRDIVASNGSLLGRLRLYEPHQSGVPADQVFVAGQMRALAIVVFLATLLFGAGCLGTCTAVCTPDRCSRKWPGAARSWRLRSQTRGRSRRRTRQTDAGSQRARRKAFSRLENVNGTGSPTRRTNSRRRWPFFAPRSRRYRTAYDSRRRKLSPVSTRP